ncbi:MAG: imelysin family protein [Solirubrobacterales bacterium]
MSRSPARIKGRSAAACAAALASMALFAAGCGDDDEDSASSSGAGGAQLAPVKDYLVEHAGDLAANVARLQDVADRYYELARSEGFDYAAMMQDHRAEVEELMTEAKEAFVDANPSYEEMEGIVAGVPRLAHYDVDIDAGSDASDPESAVSFSLRVPGGDTMKQPGNLFFLTETALYGTNPDLQAKGAEPDIDGDGQVEFGEGLADARIFKATVGEFTRQASALRQDAREFEPTPSDAFTAITIMTPTMSEYFEAWKNSHFVAGNRATEQGFVAASRLQDIADILEGIVFTYEGVQPLVAGENPAQARQTERELRSLLEFASSLRDREADGEKFTAEQADAFGAEAQTQAEAIAGQVTQSAERLNVQLQEG